uniref:Gustatory receptor n=1 Tax=Anopheles atroparvus TaxID=41427 RepID=A0A182J1D5_ANOAO
MHVFDSLRFLLRGLELLGLFPLRNHRPWTFTGEFEGTGQHYAILKFSIGIMCSLIGSGYIIGQSISSYYTLALPGHSVWPFVYIVHSITFCGVLCILPWQTFWQRSRLATLMNVLQRNERDLLDASGSASDYRNVALLATLILWNGIILHVFFHLCYIYSNIGQDTFIASYIGQRCRSKAFRVESEDETSV